METSIKSESARNEGATNESKADLTTKSSGICTKNVDVTTHEGNAVIRTHEKKAIQLCLEVSGFSQIERIRKVSRVWECPDRASGGREAPKARRAFGQTSPQRC